MKEMDEYEKHLLTLTIISTVMFIICTIVHFCIGGTFEISTKASNFGLVALVHSMATNYCLRLYSEYKVKE